MSKFRALGAGLGIFTLLAPFTFAATQQQAPKPSESLVASTSTPESKPEAKKSDTPQSADRPELQKRNSRYRIDKNDIVSLTFPLTPEFNQIVTVMPDGYITLQGADSVQVGGLTINEAGDAIKKAYAGVLHDPIINLDMKQFHKPYYTIMGQVTKPGQFDLIRDTTVSEGIANAGGLAPTAKTQVFVFHRVNDQWMEVKKFNLKEILNGKNINEDLHLNPGDMVFVPEKFITKFRKYVPYGMGLSFNPSYALW